jgi:hypothetical protein
LGVGGRRRSGPFLSLQRLHDRIEYLGFVGALWARRTLVPVPRRALLFIIALHEMTPIVIQDKRLQSERRSDRFSNPEITFLTIASLISCWLCCFVFVPGLKDKTQLQHGERPRGAQQNPSKVPELEDCHRSRALVQQLHLIDLFNQFFLQDLQRKEMCLNHKSRRNCC